MATAPLVLPFRCWNPACSPEHLSHPQFDFESDSQELPKCPKCGSDEDVRPLAVIHYLMIDRVAGKIRTANGRRMVACLPDAEQIPVVKRPMRHGGERDEANATGEPDHVTCPACKATARYKEDHAAGKIQHKNIIRI